MRAAWALAAVVVLATGVGGLPPLPSGSTAVLPESNNHIFMVAANITPTADLQGALAMCGVEAVGRVAARVGAWAKVLTTDPDVWERAYRSLGASAPVYFEPLNIKASSTWKMSRGG